MYSSTLMLPVEQEYYPTECEVFGPPSDETEGRLRLAPLRRSHSCPILFVDRLNDCDVAEEGEIQPPRSIAPYVDDIALLPQGTAVVGDSMDGGEKLFQKWRSAWYGWKAGSKYHDYPFVEPSDGSLRPARRLRGMYRRQISACKANPTNFAPIKVEPWPSTKPSSRNHSSKKKRSKKSTGSESLEEFTFAQYMERIMVEEEALNQHFYNDSLQYVRDKYSFPCVQIDDKGNAYRMKVTKEDVVFFASKADCNLTPHVAASQYVRHLKPLSNFAYLKLGKRPVSRLSGLTVRDVRQMDPSFTAKPALWIRRNALLVSLDSIRAIILRDKILVFDPDKIGTIHALRIIQEMVMTSPLTNILASRWFEFRVLEAILVAVQTNLEITYWAEIGKIPGASEPGNDVNPTDETLEALRENQHEVDKLITRTQQVVEVLQYVMDDDEDMAEMYLSDKHQNPDQIRNALDHDEIEMLLEHYVQRYEAVWGTIDLLNAAVSDSSGLTTIELAIIQNRLLLSILFTSVITVSIAGGTMFTSMLGMNMPFPGSSIRMGSSVTSFYAVVSFIVAWVAFLFCFLMYWCKKEGLHGFKLLYSWGMNNHEPPPDLSPIVIEEPPDEDVEPPDARARLKAAVDSYEIKVKKDGENVDSNEYGVSPSSSQISDDLVPTVIAELTKESGEIPDPRTHIKSIVDSYEIKTLVDGTEVPIRERENTSLDECEVPPI